MAVFAAQLSKPRALSLAWDPGGSAPPGCFNCIQGICLQGSWGDHAYSWWCSGVPSCQGTGWPPGSPRTQREKLALENQVLGLSHLSYAPAGWCPGGLRASVTARFYRIMICILAALLPLGQPSSQILDQCPALESQTLGLVRLAKGLKAASSLARSLSLSFQAPSSSVSVAAARFTGCFPSGLSPPGWGMSPVMLWSELFCGKFSATPHFATEHLHKEASLVAQMVKNLPATQETQVPALDRKDPLEKGTAPHSNILARRIPRTEEPGRLPH